MAILRDYPRFLLFGILHMFYSSPGQSFSIAIFVPSFTAAFGLSASGFGLQYSLATLASACLLPLFGPLIDRVNLRLYSVGVGLLMAAACLVTALANTVPLLFIGLLLLRFSGQSLMTQIGGVSITRFFGGQRGKALAVVGLGFSLGTAVLPVTLAYLITLTSWQKTMMFMGLSVFVLFIPVSLSLIKKTDKFQYPVKDQPEIEEDTQRQWTRKEVLKTPFFYFALPQTLLIPFVSTGLIIHLGSIAQGKGWTLEWVAAFFVVSALTGRFTSFLMGSVVDRFSARLIFPYVLMPYVLGLAALAIGNHPLTAPVWLFFSGLGVGCMGVTISVLWAEIFGIRSLGAITSTVASAQVFASALSPVFFGWLLDSGVTIEALLIGSIFFTGLVTLLAFLAPNPQKQVHGSPLTGRKSI